MSIQLVLPLQPPDRNTFQNFYHNSSHAVLLRCLKQFSCREGESYIYLWGHSGAGCTHLLQATCQEAQYHGYLSTYKSLRWLKKQGPDSLFGVENFDIICIDDTEIIVGDRLWQEALFHFYNRLQQQQKKYLLIAANKVPQHLGFILQDLVSRLAGGVLFQVRELNDYERLAALQKRASLRGIELSEDVAQFLLLRLPRHSKALFSALTRLDEATLSLQRRLTIPLVKAILHL